MCGVHGSAEKPLTCRYYNEYTCWYKPQLTNADPPHAYFLNAENFPRWVETLRFDDDGNLTNILDFEAAKQLLGGGPSRNPE